jgi:hypothetical protein
MVARRGPHAKEDEDFFLPMNDAEYAGDQNF